MPEMKMTIIGNKIGQNQQQNFTKTAMKYDETGKYFELFNSARQKMNKQTGRHTALAKKQAGGWAD